LIDGGVAIVFVPKRWTGFNVIGFILEVAFVAEDVFVIVPGVGATCFLSFASHGIGLLF
jgi:hypothetical protein